MKSPVSLQLKMSELIYDIQNKTYLTGRALNDGANHTHVANMQANDDDENQAQILRSITMAISTLRNRLCEYLDSPDAASGNDSLTPGEDIVMNLKMPSNFNASVAKTIGEAAHQYVVANAVADWFAITAKGETADYTYAAKAAMEVLEESLAKRRRPSRPE